MRSYAVSRPNTPGQMTAVFFYPEGSLIPADGVTRARSIWEVNRVLYETPGLSPWRYAWMKGHAGHVVFGNCQKQQKHSLCRQ